MPGERTITTPVVLALASLMVSIGLVAYLASRTEPPAGDAPPAPGETLVDVTTPERAAESFLDAWRKRDHGAALRISRGEARRAVQDRVAADRTLGPRARAAQQELWDAMATSRLSLVIRRTATLPEGRVRIEGMAEGDFLGEEYRRRVAFLMAPDGEDRWLVESMELGEILSDLPPVLDMPASPEDGP